MAERGGVRVVVDTAGVVAYPGAREVAARGQRTGGDPRNREYVHAHLTSTADAASEALCMDPQTSGGLLAAVHPSAASRLSATWWTVGEVQPGPAAIELR